MFKCRKRPSDVHVRPHSRNPNLVRTQHDNEHELVGANLAQNDVERQIRRWDDNGGDGGGGEQDDYDDVENRQEKVSPAAARRNEESVDRMMESLRSYCNRVLIEEEADEAADEEENSYFTDEVPYSSAASSNSSNNNDTSSSSHNTSSSSNSTGTISDTGAARRNQNNMEAAIGAQQLQEPVYLHLPRKPDRFELTEFVQELIDTANRTTPQRYPGDADQPFDLHAHKANPGAPFRSKKEVVQELVETMSVNNSTKSAINAVFGVLQRTTGLNLPVRINPRTQNPIYCWEKYLKQDSRKKWIDVCINSCHAYVGELKYATRCPNPKCREPRYRECCAGGRGNCKYGAACSPFTTPHTKRTAYTVVAYRSIIIKLLDLYKLSLSVMPEMFTYSDTRLKFEGALCDILDGAVPVQHMREMRLRYLDRKDQYARDNRGAFLHDLSLCMSAFYDGDKLYKRTDDSLWPYLISIMNCDPCFRTTLGLGLSMIFMHNMPVGSGAEQTLMDDCLTPELEQLEDGIIFEFDHPSTGERHAVFIQARLIFMHLDTRAQEKYWHCSFAGGMCGCGFCGDCKGLSRPIINTRVYPGASLFLPANHMLKCIGEDKNYIPGYYGELGDDVNSAIGKALSARARSIKIKGKGGDAPDSDFNDIADVNGMADTTEAAPVGNVTTMEHKRSTKMRKGKVWFNKRYPWKNYARACWSRFDDPFTRLFTRVQHDEYLLKDHQAGLLWKTYIDDCIRLNKPAAKDAEAKYAVFEGVHYPVSESARSLKKSLRFENAMPDYMHTAGNQADYDMKLVKGERGLDNNSAKLSRAEGLFDFLADKGNQVPWLASPYSRCYADSVFTCLNIPSQCKRDYKFDLPFHHSGFMNSHQKIVFFGVFICYIFSFTDISMPYRHYFERRSSDTNRILNPILKRDELRALFDEVVETIALREKMTPSSEHAFIFHQLIEIVAHLGRFGTIKSLMCFFGERVMHSIAAGVPDGGLSYIITVTNRIVARENAFEHNMKSYTENLKRFMNNQGRFSPKVLKLHGNFVEICLHDFNKSILFDDLVEYMLSLEIVDVVLRSPFMRLYFTHRALLDIHGDDFPSFVEWTRKLYLKYKGCGGRFNKGTLNDQGDLVHDLLFEVRPVTFTNAAVMMRDVVNKGNVFMSDFTGIISDLAQFATAGEQTIAAFTEAIVKGVEFRGRGQLYSETSLGFFDPGPIRYGQEAPPPLYEPQIPKNNLMLFWQQSFQINSWGMVEDWLEGDAPTDRRQKQMLRRVLFGQFNYFFRLYMPSDPVLHMLSLANMVLRNASEPDARRGNHRYIAMNNANHSFHHAKQFIVLNNVVGTNLALSPLDNVDYPIANPNSGVKEAVHKIKSYPLKLSKKGPTEVHRMYMIELQKEREHIKYEEILEDLDCTKCFEKVVEDHHEKRKNIVR